MLTIFINKHPMGLLSFIKFKRKHFIDDKEFKNILEEQIQISQQKIEEYLKSNFDADKTFKIEYFFITNTKNKAEKFCSVIRNLNYSSQYIYSPVMKLFLLTGSIEMKVSEDAIMHWTKEMCELGYKFESKFDGWEIIKNKE